MKKSTKQTMNSAFNSKDFVKKVENSLKPGSSSAAASGNALLTAERINQVDSTSGERPLFVALSLGKKDVAKVLIEAGADVNIKDADGYTPLHRVAQKGDVVLVKALVGKGALIDAINDNDGFTALHYAVSNGHEETVVALLNHVVSIRYQEEALTFFPGLEVALVPLNPNFSINTPTHQGLTPLHLAIENKQTGVVFRLIRCGADVNSTDTQYVAPLHLAVGKGNEILVKILLQNNARVNHADIQGATALHYAAQEGHIEITELLLANGASIDGKREDGYTPLHIAAEKGHVGTVKALLATGDYINKKLKGGVTPLYLAAWNGQVEAVKVLLENGATIGEKLEGGYTSLYISAEKGHVETVKVLLKKGAHINEKLNNGYTPLHIAAEKGHAETAKVLLEKGATIGAKTSNDFTPLHLAAEKGHVETVKILLENGADIEAKSDDGFTPLHLAAEKGHVETVKILLENGVDIEAKSDDGFTPLHLAAEKGHVEIVKALLEKGATIGAKTNNDFTPLHLAAEKGYVETVKILLENGADIEAKAKRGLTALYLVASKGHVETVKILLENGADIEAKSDGGLTALHLVASKGQVEMVPILLENGADIEAKSDGGFTPLHLAAEKGHVEIVKALLGKGATIDEKGKNGLTALHIAVEKGHAEIVQILIKKGATIEAKTQDGFTPLHYAARFGQVEILKILLENDANIEAKCNHGFTLVHFAAKYGQVETLKILLEKGAVITDRIKELKLQENIQKILEVHEELLTAIRNKDAPKVEALLLKPEAILSKPSSLPELTPEILYIILNKSLNEESTKIRFVSAMQQLKAVLTQATAAATKRGGAQTRGAKAEKGWQIVLSEDKTQVSILFTILPNPNPIIELKKDGFHIKPVGSSASILLTDPTVLLHEEKLTTFIEEIQKLLQEEVETKRSESQLKAKAETERRQEEAERRQAEAKKRQEETKKAEKEKRRKEKQAEEQAKLAAREAQNKANQEKTTEALVASGTAPHLPTGGQACALPKRGGEKRACKKELEGSSKVGQPAASSPSPKNPHNLPDRLGNSLSKERKVLEIEQERPVTTNDSALAIKEKAISPAKKEKNSTRSRVLISTEKLGKTLPEMTPIVRPKNPKTGKQPGKPQGQTQAPGFFKQPGDRYNQLKELPTHLAEVERFLKKVKSYNLSKKSVEPVACCEREAICYYNLVKLLTELHECYKAIENSFIEYPWKANIQDPHNIMLLRLWVIKSFGQPYFSDTIREVSAFFSAGFSENFTLNNRHRFAINIAGCITNILVKQSESIPFSGEKALTAPPVTEEDLRQILMHLKEIQAACEKAPGATINLASYLARNSGTCDLAKAYLIGLRVQFREWAGSLTEKEKLHQPLYDCVNNNIFICNIIVHEHVITPHRIAQFIDAIPLALLPQKTSRAMPSSNYQMYPQASSSSSSSSSSSNSSGGYVPHSGPGPK